MAFFDQAAMGFLGAALVTKVTDANIPMVLRAAYAVVGGDMVYRAVAKGNPGGSGRLLGTGDGASVKTKSSLKFESRKARTIAERVSYINTQAQKGVRDPTVYELARKVLARKCNGTWCVPERDSKMEIEAMYGEVRSRVRYTLDPTLFDAFQTPQQTLRLSNGDCDDYSALLAALCMSIGYPVQMRVVHTRGEATYNHIFLRVRMPNGEWMPLDASVNAHAGWEIGSNHYVSPPKDFEIK